MGYVPSFRPTLIPESFKQDLLVRVDIVDVVSRYVQLKKAGANHLGLCPFHNEKTPSFTVSAAKQFYHCFGCGAHGNAIGFLMSHSGMGYIDAVKDLAASVGMQVPEWQPRTPAQAAQRERETDLYAVMEKAMDFYRGELKRSPRAIEYLKGRGASGEIAARFRVGYAPDDWQGLRAAFPQYDDKSLVECGLVIENEGKRYDRFRDRVMFPILSVRGAVIGFGGRILGEGEPKYLNSPETPLFEKGRESIMDGIPGDLPSLLHAHKVQRKAATHRITEDRVTGMGDVVELAGVHFETGMAKKPPIVGPAQKPVQGDDHAQSSSKSCHTRRLASASGTISMTARLASRLLYGSFHIAAQCSNERSCVFSISRSRMSSDNARNDGTREKILPPRLLMM